MKQIVVESYIKFLNDPTPTNALVFGYASHRLISKGDLKWSEYVTALNEVYPNKTTVVKEAKEVLMGLWDRNFKLD